MLTGDQLQQFQQTIWRQRSEVFKQAIDTREFPIDPVLLCELATNELVESRLISDDQALLLGPFEFDLTDETSEQLLPDKSILLVQCLEQHLTQIDSLLEKHFDFMPRWQVDDVMASIGDTGATCGAHFDQYDVFLIQHTGTKQWQLDDGGHSEDDLAEDTDIRLLKSFSPTQTFTLSPGDVLYIPPGVGHYGLCPEQSITLSVGIRHPAQSELLAEISEFALEHASNAPAMTSGLYSGSALPESAVNDISRGLNEILDSDMVARWYGCYVTRLREPDLMDLFIPDEDVPAEALTHSASLVVTLPTRLAWSMVGKELLLFVNGEVIALPVADQDWVEHFCESRSVVLNDWPVSAPGMACLKTLLLTGAVTHS